MFCTVITQHPAACSTAEGYKTRTSGELGSLSEDLTSLMMKQSVPTLLLLLSLVTQGTLRSNMEKWKTFAFPPSGQCDYSVWLQARPILAGPRAVVWLQAMGRSSFLSMSLSSTSGTPSGRSVCRTPSGVSSSMPSLKVRCTCTIYRGNHQSRKKMK